MTPDQTSTPDHALPAAMNCCTAARRRIHGRGLAAILAGPIARRFVICCLLAGGIFAGEHGAALAQDGVVQPGQVGGIGALKDIGPMRAAQQAELNAARAETKGNNEAYRQRAAEIKNRYLQQDQRGRYIDDVVNRNGRYGGDIEGTGSNPKDVRADVDLAAKNGAAADKLTQEWKSAGHQIEDHGYKVVNKTTDTTLWKPCGTPECLAAKVRDADAWTTEGGLKATGNTERIRDPRGQYLDNAKKFFHAKDDFVHATANPDAIDELKLFESVKTAAKSLDKASAAAGTRQADDFWQKVENIRNRYMDPWEAGIADPNDPPAKQVKDIEKFLADAEARMNTAEEVLTRRAEVIDKQVREKIQEDLRNARQADPANKAMDQEGAEAVKTRREKVKASNEAVEDLLTEQGAKQPVKAADAPDGGVIEEPLRLTETGEAPPKTTAPVDDPPVVSGGEPDTTRTKTARVNPDTEPAPVTEQPGVAGAESSLRKSAAAAAKSAATGAGVGSLLGAATTYLTCMTVLSADANNENCLTAAGQSIPEAGFWGAVGALGTAGAVVAGIYGVYQTGLAVQEAIEEEKRLSGALETEQQAASRLSAARVVEQEFISRARRACNYQRALDVAKELRRRPPPPSWLAATMPHLESGAAAQKNVTKLLAISASASNRDTKVKLLRLAHNVAAGVPCLQQRAQAALSKLEPDPPAEVSTQPDSKSATTQPGGRDCDPNKVASSRKGSDGFVPVEYKGATAWTGEYNPDCPPFGPSAKGPTNDGGGGDPAKLPAPKELCGKVDTALGRARDHYLAGRVSEYRIALVNARQEIGAIGDPKACAGQRGEIASGSGRADLLEKVIASADQALKSCDEANLRKLSGLLSTTNHPHVARLRERADRMATVASQVGQADAARAAGRTEASRLYRLAAAELNAVPGACPDLAQRVRDGQQPARVTALVDTPAPTGLANATNTCKANYGTHGMAVPNPDSVTGYTCDCADPYRLEGGACVREKSAHERADAAHGACRESFGGSAYAQPKDATYKEYGCLCGKGHTWNANRTQCVQQTQEQVIADANHRCQVANRNKRARAGKYLGNEQWSCVIDRSRSEIIADAHRACQRANGNNPRVRAVKPLANGQWSCHIPGPRRVVTQRPQRQPHQPNYDAAVAAATAAAVMQGLGSLMRTQTVRPPMHRGVPHSSCQLDINRPLSQTCPSAYR